MARRAATKKRQQDTVVEFYVPQKNVKDAKPLRPMTKKQELYLNSLRNNTITVGIGCAGVGKTFMSTVYAVDELTENNVTRLVFVRPTVECGDSLGFLPGELSEKIDPYYAPIKDIIKRRVGVGPMEYYLKAGTIEFRPLAFMRGSTFNDCIVILDEAQNTTKEQMLMFLTRIGKNCKVVVDGDFKQSDIKGLNGLYDLMKRHHRIPLLGVVEFTAEDVVRSGIVKDILRAYED